MIRTRRLVVESLRVSRNRNYIYLNNPKSACTSVKNTLIDIENSLGSANIEIEGSWVIHDRRLEIFDYRPEAFRRGLEYCFSFVRNPFARALSVYLEKVGPGTEEGFEFRKAIGADRRQKLSFMDFVRALNRIPLREDNRHWRAQSVNLMFGKMPIHFLGYVESFDRDMGEVIRHIYGRDMPITSYVRHSVSAKDRLDEYLNDEAVELIIEKYRDDFDNFNYSRDYRIQEPLQRIGKCGGDDDWLLEIEQVLREMKAA